MGRALGSHLAPGTDLEVGEILLFTKLPVYLTKAGVESTRGTRDTPVMADSFLVKVMPTQSFTLGNAIGFEPPAS